MQANHNKPKTTQTSQTTRKSPSQICVSSKKNSKPDTQKGQEPKQKHPQRGFAKGHSGLTTASRSKTCQNELSTTTFSETWKSKHRACLRKQEVKNCTWSRAYKIERTGQAQQKQPQKICQDTVVKTHCVATDSKTCSKRIYVVATKTTKSRNCCTLSPNPASQSPRSALRCWMRPGPCTGQTLLDGNHPREESGCGARCSATQTTIQVLACERFGRGQRPGQMESKICVVAAANRNPPQRRTASQTKHIPPPTQTDGLWQLQRGRSSIPKRLKKLCAAI